MISCANNSLTDGCLVHASFTHQLLLDQDDRQIVVMVEILAFLENVDDFAFERGDFFDLAEHELGLVAETAAWTGEELNHWQTHLNN